MESNPTTVTEQPTGFTDDHIKMNWIAHQLRHSSTGQRAALRRVPLTKSFEADAVVITLIADPKFTADDRYHDLDRWRMIAHVAAMLVGTGEPGPNRPFVHTKAKTLGNILGKLDYSETRMLRLLSVRGKALDDQVRRVARLLAQKNERQFDFQTLYHLLDGGGDGDCAKAARIRIAHDYYAAKP